MSNGIVIDCEFDYFSGDYTCFVKNVSLITSIDDRVITGTKGEHKSGKTNDDVTHFYAHKKTINFFPQNLTNFFKNLKTIKIMNAELQQITKDDLKEFGDKLTNLSFYSNEIEVLDRDLFVFNKNMEQLDLSYNRIQRMYPFTFKGLKKVYLQYNPCTSSADSVTHNHFNVMDLARKIEARCNDPFMAEKFEEIAKLNLKLKTIQKELKEKKLEVEKMDAKLSSQKEEIRLKNEKIQRFEFESSMENYTKRMELFEKEQFKNLTDEIENLNAIISEQQETIQRITEDQITTSELNLKQRERFEKTVQDLTSKSTNEVKNLIEGQILFIEAKMEMQSLKLAEELDFASKFKELNEKIEELSAKVGEDAKKVIPEAREKILNTNMEKFDENLKNLNPELQEKFKEIKKYIEAQKANKALNKNVAFDNSRFN